MWLQPQCYDENVFIEDLPVFFNTCSAQKEMAICAVQFPTIFPVLSTDFFNTYIILVIKY